MLRGVAIPNTQLQLDSPKRARGGGAGGEIKHFFMLPPLASPPTAHAYTSPAPGVDPHLNPHQRRTCSVPTPSPAPPPEPSASATLPNAPQPIQGRLSSLTGQCPQTQPKPRPHNRNGQTCRMPSIEWHPSGRARTDSVVVVSKVQSCQLRTLVPPISEGTRRARPRATTAPGPHPPQQTQAHDPANTADLPTHSPFYTPLFPRSHSSSHYLV